VSILAIGFVIYIYLQTTSKAVILGFHYSFQSIMPQNMKKNMQEKLSQEIGIK